MKKYLVKTATNFSIGDQEFYLKVGDTVDLPGHDLVTGMLVHGHIEISTQKIKETKQP